ncbi:Crp/Fnr family transcriptional regulator [Fulvivirga sp. M361]|uniref:Crp/Fnr family transcriptional regulator n=1 Tax=Fulvivirga sp. M361 TaxID=2594266 RepID=UPI00117AF745|nr:Crp/Fnr family transcriptional regulator [Fulvivirga sp. M361]TRX56135.1 Crp/Fnr family transcriptional regulator [Fulvivirga sp. M361]
MVSNQAQLLLPLKKHIEEATFPMTNEEFEPILGHFDVIRRKKHQFVVQEHDQVRNEFWVLKGCLKAYFVDGSGKEHIIQFAQEEWWITDYEAFLKQSQASIFIECIEDCELLTISLENREKLCQEQHRMALFWANKTKFGFLALQKRILSLLKNNAKERYEEFLRLYPSLLQRVPKKMIASFLGVSRETLSRLE